MVGQKNGALSFKDATKRTEFSKTFLMSDGSYTLALYKEPVHYQDAAGNWQDIDNTLSLANRTDEDTSQPDSSDSQNLSSDAASSNIKSSPDASRDVGSRIDSNPKSSSNADHISQGVNGQGDSSSTDLSEEKAVVDAPELVNKAAKSKIKLSTKLKSGKTVTIKRDGRTLKWGLEGAEAVKSHVVAHNASDAEQNGDDRFLAVKKVTSEVAYDDAFPKLMIITTG